jgi:hypothetical protein
MVNSKMIKVIIKYNHIMMMTQITVKNIEDVQKDLKIKKLSLNK